MLSVGDPAEVWLCSDVLHLHQGMPFFFFFHLNICLCAETFLISLSGPAICRRQMCLNILGLQARGEMLQIAKELRRMIPHIGRQCFPSVSVLCVLYASMLGRRQNTQVSGGRLSYVSSKLKKLSGSLASKKTKPDKYSSRFQDLLAWGKQVHRAGEISPIISGLVKAANIS